ncbi:PulJ/GspJ family protein [Thauera aromatica]|uniref:PulJ/GspJ family protein n=1 Tax=Thauera aromatica TaxID=59405 RepID=UPI001FFC3665|nr:prepilin-type N-terminal cleavage/methylation domain-containing protein [Thauera aromatica]MCK2094556.1 prepilin-type N-terminal cleavage/methylation domain-containing protein [Thauera aromatica]
MKQSSGFTLIEVLVAITLMAAVSIIAWKGLDAIGRASERLFAGADDTLELVRVLGQLERDLQRHAGSDVLPPAAPREGVPVPASLPPGIVAGEHGLALVRMAAEGAWQQVRWSVEDRALRRAVGPAARHLPLPEPDQADTVLENINAFQVRAWLPGRGWTALSALPSGAQVTGLEVVVERQGPAGTESYRKVVPLP